MKRLGNRGQLWTEIIGGIFTIAIVSLLYIVLQQVYEYEFRPHAIEEGTDSNNLTYLDIAWDFLPVPVTIAIVWAMISVGRKQRSVGYG